MDILNVDFVTNALAEEDKIKQLYEVGAFSKLNCCKKLMSAILGYNQNEIVGMRTLGRKQVVSISRYDSTYTGIVYGFTTSDGDVVVRYYDGKRRKNCVISTRASDPNRKINLSVATCIMTVSSIVHKLDDCVKVDVRSLEHMSLNHFSKYCMTYEHIAEMCKRGAVSTEWCRKRVYDLANTGVIDFDTAREWELRLCK